MPEYRTEPLISTCASGLLPEGECNRRVALTSFNTRENRAKVPAKEVVCYECGRRSRVPSAALSANCIHCHAHLRMTDVELKPNSRRLTVRTLGNVTVQADAVLSQLSIVCHNMYLNGKGNGSFRCTGRMRITTDTQIDGEVHVGSLHISRGTVVAFTRGAFADTVDIYGKVSGRIEATGKVKLHRGAQLCGDCYCPMLIIKPGASHDGRWVKNALSAGVAAAGVEVL
ncbi:MAG: polymer-forming cytoskeletal protein [Akkermansia sp.]|nr:polymer-forming cytoskeletal protein [Akkermansia sp.]